MTARPDIVAVILAGGDGRRMGGGKPLRAYGDTTLIGRAVALASGYADTVAVAVRDLTQVVGLAQPRCLIDPPGLAGPIAGLASALGFARSYGARAVLTLPCDTPHLPPDLADRLGDALAANVEVAMATSGGRLHPTCALWRTVLAGRLPAYVAGGGSSLRGFAQSCGLAEVEWPAAAGDPFANANTPEDLVRLQPAAASAASGA